MRLAIVMYGGVSLCIYMNGIAQELLRLVRATASVPGDTKQARPMEQLQGTERVYRKLGQLLPRASMGNPPSPQPTDPIRTRFVVDVLSGTSAGGLNAIFLAKALANGQDLASLKRMWIDEGDIGLLLNDEHSATADGVTAQQPPRSLLNSQRMYRKLLEAFSTMDEGQARSGPQTVSPYVEELDLFVTATDVYGLPVPLRLADRLVYENRHRHVFHLRYCKTPEAPTQLNDFEETHNTLLAFAARSTSSFPFAFEPIQAGDVNELLGKLKGWPHDSRVKLPEWQRFFPSYQAPARGLTEEETTIVSPKVYAFENHSFADGGALDNKPFGYAIDALALRHSSVPVTRKLIYIEPSPKHAEELGLQRERPDAIRNTLAALSLARYETIREDLQRVLARNRLLQRVEHILSGMEEDVRAVKYKPPPKSKKFSKQNLQDLIAQEGVGYGGYHRLKISAVTDDICQLIASVARLDPDSDHFIAIRQLVSEWRELRYRANVEDGEESKVGQPLRTQSEFLLRYDLDYRVRRLTFVMGRIDRLAALDKRTDELLKLLNVKGPVPQQGREGFRKQLHLLRGKLTPVFQRLRYERERLGESHELRKAIFTAPIDLAQLRTILEQPGSDAQAQEARKLLEGKELQDSLIKVEELLTAEIKRITYDAANQCEALLGEFKGEESVPEWSDPAAVASYAVRYYYHRFDHYDLIAFPILYSTEVGEESDTVDVLRISPEDATSLLDERAAGFHKVAGNELGHFGAFLEREWREDDILWGRLDGAERLISMLLPGKDEASLRQGLILEAQREILLEELPALREAANVGQLLQKALDELRERKLGGRAESDALRLPADDSARSKAKDLHDKNRLREAPNPILEFALKGVVRSTDREASMRNLARATQVVGRMFDGMGRRYPLTHPALWLTRFGRVLWGLVEVAVPQSFASMLVAHWLSIIYLFSGLLIVGGTLLSRPEAQWFGLSTLGITAAAHLTITLLRDFLRRGSWLWKPIVLLLGVPLGLMAIGVATLFQDDLRAALAARLSVALHLPMLMQGLRQLEERLDWPRLFVVLGVGVVGLLALVGASTLGGRLRRWARRLATGKPAPSKPVARK